MSSISEVMKRLSVALATAHPTAVRELFESVKMYERIQGGAGTRSQPTYKLMSNVIEDNHLRNVSRERDEVTLRGNDVKRFTVKETVVKDAFKRGTSNE